MEDCCVEIVSDVSSLASNEAVKMTIEVKAEDISSMDDAARKRLRRKLRMDYIRNKRSSKINGEPVNHKRSRQDPVFVFPFPLVCTSSSGEEASMDSAKIRQLKNRESAERSRLKKDNLVDSLTCQVCDFYVQLSDLQSENAWLSSLLNGGGDSSSVCSGYTSNDSMSVASSGYTTSCSSPSSSGRDVDSVSSPLSSASSSPYYSPSSSGSCQYATLDCSPCGASPLPVLPALKRARSYSFDSHCSSLSSESSNSSGQASLQSDNSLAYSADESTTDSNDWWLDEGFDLLLDGLSGNGDDLFA